MRVERGRKRWLRESAINGRETGSIKRTVLAVEYCLVRSAGSYLQEARQFRLRSKSAGSDERRNGASEAISGQQQLGRCNVAFALGRRFYR